MSDESTEHSQQVIDERIMSAIRLLHELKLPDTHRNGADEATKAYIEAWIDNNKAEIDQRIMVSWKRSQMPI
jgi:hypothetical protein